MAPKPDKKTKLARKRCKPCEGGMPPLGKTRAEALLTQVPGWRLRTAKLTRTVRFEDFLTLMEFVNDLAQLAEEQGHHPDFRVRYSRLDLELTTHAIGGLSENDFILAAKIDELVVP